MTKGSAETLVREGEKDVSGSAKTISSAQHRQHGVEPNGSPLPFLDTPQDIAQRLVTDLTRGLTAQEAESRLRRDGPNALRGGGGVSAIRILATQLLNAMTAVLVICMVVAFAIQSWIEGGVLSGIIILNVSVGFYQEYGAAKTMDSLRSLASPSANVVRDSKVSTIPATDLVLGDLVQVKTGDTIPADLRLIEASNFETDEALLTGESLPVAKDVNAIWNSKESGFDPLDVGVGDRINMAYTSSTVTKGRATGIVISTGMQTEIGAIAESLRGGDTLVRKVRRDEDGHAPWTRYPAAWGLTAWDIFGTFLGTNTGTPLQRTLSWLAIMLFLLAGVLALIVFAANSFRTDNPTILYAISTGLCMIPASLVVVLTITLAGGTRAMVKRNVIVRKLDSLEALGAITDICSDKTGTLTQGKMVCQRAWMPACGTILVGQSNEPFNPTVGDLSFTSQSPVESKLSSQKETERENNDQTRVATAREMLEAHGQPLESLLDIASLCNVAKVFEGDEGWTARGDPTECAIQVLAHRFQWGRESLTEGDNKRWTVVKEYPFDSDLKRMSVIVSKNDKEQHVLMKGAVERILEACTLVHTAAGNVSLDQEMEKTVLANVEALAEQGLRVLALAAKPWTGDNDAADRTTVEDSMVLQGLVGLYDPPRPETEDAVRRCHGAGIAVHMLTGDHASTARAIAQQVGILPRHIDTLGADTVKSMVMTASQFDKLSDAEVDALPLLPLVVARCAPHTKVRMVDALHRRNAFCAMTGDGVNDSPSLKRADVGIAMGQNGSDVAKDASDIILTDDNFASILNAIEEGRRMFDNVQAFILHLLSGNVMLCLSLLVGLAFKDVDGRSVFPLSPIEILWILIITSAFPAFGLGAQPASPDILNRPPHDRRWGVFTKEVLVDIVVYGLFGALSTLLSFVIVVYGANDGALGRNSNVSLEGSEPVFRARSATFVTMTWLYTLLAWECMNLRRSFFLMHPEAERPGTQWLRDVYSNKLLFWSVSLGVLTVFPFVYIPGLNNIVMQHTVISWELGLAFGMTLLFIGLLELWKWGKRAWFRRREAAGRLSQGVLDPFAMFSNDEGQRETV